MSLSGMTTKTVFSDGERDILTGVKHLRVRVFKAVRFAAVMKAAAVICDKIMAGSADRVRLDVAFDLQFIGPGQRHETNKEQN